MADNLKKSRYNYMNPEDFERVLAAVEDLELRKFKVKDVQMLFKILYWCGLRFDEGIKLEYMQINLIDQVIFLGKTKTEKAGKAIIPKLFLEEFEEWLLEKNISGRLFEGLTYNTAIRWIYRLGEKLNIDAWVIPQSVTGEKTKSHIFRKSIAKDIIYGTHTKEKGEVTYAAKALRHTNIKTTADYLKIDDEEMKEFWN